jgi:hypothetical protein
VQPGSESRKAHLAVIFLIGLAFVALSNISMFDFEVQALRGYLGAGSYFQTVFETREIATFLMSPCLLFVALYFYGKRTAQHFKEGYLGATLSLFLGSCVGFVLYICSVPLIEGGPSALSLLSSFDAVFGILTTGVQNAFVGIAAFALSRLNAEPSAAIPEGLPESTIP